MVPAKKKLRLKKGEVWDEGGEGESDEVQRQTEQKANQSHFFAGKEGKRRRPVYPSKT